MKKLVLTIRDIIVILLLLILAQIIAGIDPSGNFTSRPVYVYLKTDLLAPFIYTGLFLLGFHLLKHHLFHNPFPTITPYPQFSSRDLGYIILLNLLIAGGYFLIGVKVVFPTTSHYLINQNLITNISNDFIAAPLVEEITFRGVILGQVTKRYNLPAGIIVSSILFGCAHLLNGSLTMASALQLVISGTLFGGLLALIYLQEGTIWANYLVHASYNLIWDLIPCQTTVTHDWPIQLIFHTKNLFLTGGQYGSDCSLANNLAYLIMIGLLLYLIAQKKVVSDFN